MFVGVGVRQWDVVGGLLSLALCVVFATGTGEMVSWWWVGPATSVQVGFGLCGVAARGGLGEGRG